MKYYQIKIFENNKIIVKNKNILHSLFTCVYDRRLFLTTILWFDGAGPQDLQIDQTRVRSFPHVDGNYALHVYIPSKLIMIWKESCLSLNILFYVFLTVVMLLQRFIELAVYSLVYAHDSNHAFRFIWLLAICIFVCLWIRKVTIIINNICFWYCIMCLALYCTRFSCFSLIVTPFSLGKWMYNYNR